MYPLAKLYDITRAVIEISPVNKSASRRILGDFDKHGWITHLAIKDQPAFFERQPERSCVVPAYAQPDYVTENQYKDLWTAVTQVYADFLPNLEQILGGTRVRQADLARRIGLNCDDNNWITYDLMHALAAHNLTERERTRAQVTWAWKAGARPELSPRSWSETLSTLHNSSQSSYEARVAALLIERGLHFIPQFRLPGARHKAYDFFIPSLNCLLEVHGEQHDTIVPKFHPNGDADLILQIKNDIRFRDAAEAAGYCYRVLWYDSIKDDLTHTRSALEAIVRSSQGDEDYEDA